MTPENLNEINFQRGNFKIAPQYRFRINWVVIEDTTVLMLDRSFCFLGAFLGWGPH